MHDLARRIELLSSEDRIILHEAIDQHLDSNSNNGFQHASRMSIFSDSYETSQHAKYTIDYFQDELFYLGRNIFTLAPIYIDHDYRIVFASNGALSRPESFIECIDYYLKNVNHMKHTGLTPVTGFRDILAVQTWYPSYGHIHDELYILEDCHNSLNSFRSSILDYHLDSKLIKNIDPCYNYIEMQYKILRAYSININLRPNALASVTGLGLVRNSVMDACFHSFPIEVSNRVINDSVLAAKATVLVGYDYTKPLFLSRMGGARSHRLIGNISDIEQELRDAGYNVVYPELHGFFEVIYMISRAPSIILTWGSAMTNLAYAINGIKVTVLKAKSYKAETLMLFEKIVSSRELYLNILNATDENLIDISRI